MNQRSYNGDRFREIDAGVTSLHDAPSRICTWFREGESQGHNKTTTSPASRTAILLLLSLFPLDLSLFPSAPLFRAFILSPFNGYRQTLHLRQLIDISPFSWISVTKLPAYLFSL